MKGWKGFVLGMLTASLLHMFIFGWSAWSETLTQKWEDIWITSDSQPPSLTSNPDRGMPDLEQDETNEAVSAAVRVEDHLLLEGQSKKEIFLGMNEEELTQTLGEPQRRDLSPYGYTWWIYNQDWETYIQIGVKDGKVVTVYTNAPDWRWGDLAVGLPGSAWQEKREAKESISFYYKLNFFTFDLSSPDILERPLFLEGETAIQLYIDIHNEEMVSGIRLMDLETLLLHRPYALKYVGELPELPELTSLEWKKIERATEQQIFDIVNNTRLWYELAPFDWHGEVAEVARAHSLDMGMNDFFDHVSPQNGDLGDRLQKASIPYQSAGENIAWNYVDGADAHQGWLNSPGHRKNVMQKDFTHLGVGIIQKHYTQNFLKP